MTIQSPSYSIASQLPLSIRKRRRSLLFAYRAGIIAKGEEEEEEERRRKERDREKEEKMPDTESSSLTMVITKDHSKEKHNGLDYEEGDLVRILVQALYDHGYNATAESLEEESGIQMESKSIRQFRKCILQGDYEGAIEAMPVSDIIRYELQRERYLELLEARKIKEALTCLRNHVTPYAPDEIDVQKLATLIMAGTAQEVRTKSAWCGAGNASRQALLDRVQFLMPKAMLPFRRLDQLIQQAFKFQESKCISHFPGPQFNGIILNHQCLESELTLKKDLEFTDEHTDEIWHCSFSHNGEYLATASKDNSVIIWSIIEGEVSVFQRLTDHTAGVMHIAWSPNDEALLTCSLDSRARLWDVQTGKCTRVFLLNGEANAGVWTEDGTGLVIASQDGILTKFSQDGASSMKKQLRCLDILSIGNDRIAILDHTKTVHILNVKDLSSITSFTECSDVSSIAVSKDGKSFLLNAVDSGNAEVNLWEPSLPNDCYDVNVTYYGHTNQKYLIRSCFAHESEALVVTGCETGSIFLFHRTNAHLVQKIHAHNGPVNCVTWTDKHGGLLASVGDDRKIIIWRKSHNDINEDENEKDEDATF